MKETVKIALRLFAVTLIAAVLLGVTYSITKEPIKEQQIMKEENARKLVLPQAASFEKIDITDLPIEYSAIKEVYVGTNLAGETAGVTILMEAKGYNPGIVLTIGISAKGTIERINVGDHDETPGLGAKAQDAEFSNQFTGKQAPLNVVKNNANGHDEIEAISGATRTSKGITDAVNTAAEFFENYLKEEWQ